VDADQSSVLIQDLRRSFQRLGRMIADLHPTDEADPAKELFTVSSGSLSRCVAV
jgi:hypothetical protein